MSPGGAKRGSFGLDQRAQRRRVVGELDQLLERALEALQRPGAAALVQEPEAGHVAQDAHRAGDAALVGEVGGEAAVVDDGVVELDAHQRPRAGADVRRAGLAERARRRRPTRCRASPGRSRGCPRRRSARRPPPSARRAPCRAATTSPSRRSGDAEPREHVAGPGARTRVVALGGGGVGALRGRHAAEPQAEQVGDQQDARRARRGRDRARRPSRRARRRC